MGPTERLERAIDKITTHGWCQNAYGSPHRGYCTVGALTWAQQSGAIAIQPEALAALWLVTEVLGLDQPRRLITWNDEPGRQAHEVIGALVMAAELSRKREFVEEPELAPA